MREWIEMQAFSGSPIGCIVVLPRMREWIEIIARASSRQSTAVLPRMREWIEILREQLKQKAGSVLPRMREWIEIFYQGGEVMGKGCSPSYEGVD